MPARTLALGVSATLLATMPTMLGGCSSTSRPDGPPKARAYAPTVWQATPPALNQPRLVSRESW